MTYLRKDGTALYHLLDEDAQEHDHGGYRTLCGHPRAIQIASPCGCSATVELLPELGLAIDYCAAHGAAPDLLAACRSLASHVYATTNPALLPSTYREAQKAIANAEGI